MTHLLLVIFISHFHKYYNEVKTFCCITIFKDNTYTHAHTRPDRKSVTCDYFGITCKIVRK